MPSAFNFNASPFDCLNADERDLVRRSVDIEYFPENATVLAPGQAPTHLFVIIKGHVQQWDGDVPVELTGSVEFPRIGKLPYLLTLPGHGFYWFELCESREETS